MDKIIWLNLALWISGFFLVLAFFLLIYEAFKNKWKSVSQKLMAPSFFLLLCILILRLLLGYYDNNERSRFEHFLHSGQRTLQTFSLDEQYGEVLDDGKKIFYENNKQSIKEKTNKAQTVPHSVKIYGFLTTISSLFASIIVATFILGIFTNVFARLKFVLFWKEKYVFSELNDRAINLAESIYNKSEIFRRPLIIFTDSYIKSDDEILSELNQRAKQISAICIKEDMSKVSFKASYNLTKIFFFLSLKRKITYILIDEKDIDNIRSLIDYLSCEKLENWKKGCQFYLFSHHPEVESVRNKLNNNKRLENHDIGIVIVSEYTRMIYNLFDNAPLYEPLIRKEKLADKDKNELVLTIVGGGKLGMEAFLTAYWCGQMLDYKLRINVITDDADKFKAIIEQTNPQIFEVSSILDDNILSDCFEEDSNHDHPLKVYPNNAKKLGKIYSHFLFRSIDVNTSDLNKILNEPEKNGFSLLHSDYFIICLGTDELNISIANEINKMILVKALDPSIMKKVEPPVSKMPIIAYSVYDSKTNELLNKQNTRSTNDKICPYLHAFASRRYIYSYDNILNNRFERIAEQINRQHYGEDKDSKKMFRADEYSWWSSIARALHFKYKVFSTGVLDDKREPGEIFKKDIKNYSKKICINYIKFNLMQLEHRRWNAFMRVNGFIAPNNSQFESYAFLDGKDHKYLELKLHPLMVECTPQINIEYMDWSDEPTDKFDLLDYMSYRIYKKKREKMIKPECEENKKEKCAVDCTSRITCNKINCNKYKCDRIHSRVDSECDVKCNREKKCKKTELCKKTDYKLYDMPERDLYEKFMDDYVKKNEKKI